MIIFDIDGTLLPGTSCERIFVRHLIAKKMLGLKHLVSFKLRAITLLPRGLAHSIKANKGYLRGFDAGEMADVGRDFFRENMPSRISQKGIARLNEHKNRGETVILLSGMPDFLLKNFAEHLGVREFYGSAMEIQSGKFTGRTNGPFPLGRGKVSVAQSVLARYRLGWNDLTFYGDHWLDRFLLARVGRPVVVNPGRKLKAFAEKRGWEIEIFD